MKAIQLLRSEKIDNLPLEAREVEKPEPKHGQVLIKVAMCGVCHTDLHTVEGDITPTFYPITPGHQVVGVVELLGEGVDIFKVGDRVGVPWLHRACGQCEHCLRGDENLCSKAEFTGFDVNGGYAEYLIADAAYTLPIPDEIDDEQAAPLLCAGIIGYRSLRKAGLSPGERLGLVGFGASAHIAIQVASFWGCESYVFTRSDGHRKHAAELGAAWVGGADDSCPKPLDRAVIFAPAGRLVPVMLEKIRPGGTLAINAIHMSPIPEMPYAKIYGERTLRSVANATYRDGLDFLRLAAKIPIRATTTAYPLEAANQALIDLKHSRINGEAVLRV